MAENRIKIRKIRKETKVQLFDKWIAKTPAAHPHVTAFCFVKLKKEKFTISADKSKEMMCISN